jgi:hypothetical protein
VEGQPKIRQAPDALVAFGRPKGYRGSYRQWVEGGIPPHVVFEVLSPNNRHNELIRKFQFYDRHGVEEYYVFDPSTQMRSPVFRIAEDVYYPVLRAACRMYYLQRENMPLEKKYIEGLWSDEAILTQDKEARAVWAKEDASTARDLAGGWMDAGDTNKYPTFLGEVIHPLLYAYENNPKAFGDDYNIPESGNGLPDVLDEVKYELEWLRKMQDSDGGVFIKLGNVDYSSAKERKPRYYGPKNSAMPSKPIILPKGILYIAPKTFDIIPAIASIAAPLINDCLLELICDLPQNNLSIIILTYIGRFAENIFTFHLISAKRLH